MTVYLIHLFEPIGSLTNPLGRAQHYIGSANQPWVRFGEHKHGYGSALLREANRQGIDYTISRMWPGYRKAERILKNRKEAARLCPICSGVDYAYSIANYAGHPDFVDKRGSFFRPWGPLYHMGPEYPGDLTELDDFPFEDFPLIPVWYQRDISPDELEASRLYWQPLYRPDNEIAHVSR